ncbi:hypothetical protein N7499_011026 [Penicillium canescens]|nr:hypothetical protein N7499_011026 [Penicillium canescens]KAJ6182810.1 hypothetical protein N7485_001452 [Penicillium canescens]
MKHLSRYLANVLAAVSVVAADPQPLPAEYTSVCPLLNGEKATIDGAVVEIHCGAYPVPYNPTALSGIASLRDCA